MSPALFDRRPVRQLADLAGHVLLVTETRPGDWTDWLDHAGLQPAAESRRRVFDHFFVTLQAVVDGLGLGIGPLPVLQADLSRPGVSWRRCPRSPCRGKATSPSSRSTRTRHRR